MTVITSHVTLVVTSDGSMLVLNCVSKGGECLMRLIQELVDKYNCSKYSIAKDLRVSWNTVHMWYREVFEPSKEKEAQIEEKYKSITKKKT